HQTVPALDRPRTLNLGAQPQRLVQRARRQDVHAGKRNPVYGRAVPHLARRLAVARGDEPADLVLRGGRVLSVFTREWLETDVAIADGYVAGLGDYDGAEIVDAAGRHVVAGCIGAH